MRPVGYLLGLTLALQVGACGRGALDEPVASGMVGTTSVKVFSRTGALAQGPNDLRLEFRDANNEAFDVEGPSVTFRTPEATAAEAQRLASVEHRGVGIYAATVELPRAGTWQGNVTWGEAGQPRQWTFTSVAQ